MTYLDTIRFDSNDAYSVEVDDDGVTVYSECCASTMSMATTMKLYQALGRNLQDHHVDELHGREHHEDELADQKGGG